jgi:hypothetical protein
MIRRKSHQLRHADSRIIERIVKISGQDSHNQQKSAPAAPPQILTPTRTPKQGRQISGKPAWAKKRAFVKMQSMFHKRYIDLQNHNVRNANENIYAIIQCHKSLMNYATSEC